MKPRVGGSSSLLATTPELKVKEETKHVNPIIQTCKSPSNSGVQTRSKENQPPSKEKVRVRLATYCLKHLDVNRNH